MEDYHINIFYSDEDEGYIADIPDLEACSAFGNTAEDALRASGFGCKLQFATILRSSRVRTASCQRCDRDRRSCGGR